MIQRLLIITDIARFLPPAAKGLPIHKSEAGESSGNSQESPRNPSPNITERACSLLAAKRKQLLSILRSSERPPLITVLPSWCCRVLSRLRIAAHSYWCHLYHLLFYYKRIEDLFQDLNPPQFIEQRSHQGWPTKDLKRRSCSISEFIPTARTETVSLLQQSNNYIITTNMPSKSKQQTPAPRPLTAAEKREKEHMNAEKLMEKAPGLLQEADQSFLVQSQRDPKEYPTFDRNEILFGPVLGVGGFGIVFEIKGFSLNLPTEVSVDSNSEDGAIELEAYGGEAHQQHHHREDSADSSSHLVLEQPLPQGNTTTNNTKPSSVDSSQTTDTTTYTQQQDTTLGLMRNNNHTDATNHPNNHRSVDDPHYDIQTARQHMAEHARRNGDARYAVKRLHRDLSELEMARGKIDLAIEAKFLSALWHSNISKFIHVKYCVFCFLHS